MKPPNSAMRNAALELAKRLVAHGYTAYFAGGSVRDLLLGRVPKDYDIATSATPTEVLKLFPSGNQVGAHFGVIVVHHRSHQIEIATFRIDGCYKDGRHPETVTFASPEYDAKRRDFTVNGMFENPFSGEILDYVGGRRDLQARQIRAIGDPQLRFSEDALRLLRAVRFTCCLDFTLEATTEAALHQHAALLRTVAPERIRDEFSQILLSSQRANGLDLLVSTNLIDWIIPEVRDLIGCEQPPQWHPEGDVYTHTRIMLAMIPERSPLELCLAVLLHDIGKPATYHYDQDAERIRFNGHDVVGAEMTEKILKRLRYPNELIAKVCAMVARHMQFMNVQEMRTAKLRRFMSASEFPLELELHRVDCASSNGFTDNYEFLLAKTEEFAAEPLIPPPLVTGKDLIARGLKPGPNFKLILDELQTEQLEGRIADRESALVKLEQIISSF